MRDTQNGQSRGFGFVTYKKDSVARRLILEIKETEILGKKVDLRIAEPKYSDKIAHINKQVFEDNMKKSHHRKRREGENNSNNNNNNGSRDRNNKQRKREKEEQKQRKEKNNSQSSQRQIVKPEMDDDDEREEGEEILQNSE